MRTLHTTTYTSESAHETRALGAVFAASIAREPRLSHARVVALSGNLGAGKTTFMQGLAKGFSIRTPITSPTFIIMKYFRIPKRRQTLLHIDAYRITTAKELLLLGLKEELGRPGNIIVIEWAERVRTLLPNDTIWIRFTHGRHEGKRHIQFSQKISYE